MEQGENINQLIPTNFIVYLNELIKKLESNGERDNEFLIQAKILLEFVLSKEADSLLPQEFTGSRNPRVIDISSALKQALYELKVATISLADARKQEQMLLSDVEIVHARHKKELWQAKEDLNAMSRLFKSANDSRMELNETLSETNERHKQLQEFTKTLERKIHLVRQVLNQWKNSTSKVVGRVQVITLIQAALGETSSTNAE